jgi:hypothetical protein
MVYAGDLRVSMDPDLVSNFFKISFYQNPRHSQRIPDNLAYPVQKP